MSARELYVHDRRLQTEAPLEPGGAKIEPHRYGLRLLLAGGLLFALWISLQLAPLVAGDLLALLESLAR